MQAVAQTMEEALTVEGLTRRFGALTAVNDVTLRIKPGERRAVLGANGAGKTTLFNMIAGDLAPSAGRITLFGEDITGLSAQRRVLAGVRRTYQKSLVFAGLSVRDNLYIAIRGATGARMAIARRAEAQPDRHQTDTVAERVGLTDKLDTLAGEMSHGEQRQLELGMALAHPPRLLLLDEPAAGLSARERGSLMAMLADLPRDLTLIIIEHDLDIALKAADYVSVMHNGDLLAEGTPAEVSANQDIQDMYMGRHGK